MKRNKTLSNISLAAIFVGLFLCVGIVNAQEYGLCVFSPPDNKFAEGLNKLASDAATKSFINQLDNDIENAKSNLQAASSKTRYYENRANEPSSDILKGEFIKMADEARKAKDAANRNLSRATGCINAQKEQLKTKPITANVCVDNRCWFSWTLLTHKPTNGSLDADIEELISAKLNAMAAIKDALNAYKKAADASNPDVADNATNRSIANSKIKDAQLANDELRIVEANFNKKTKSRELMNEVLNADLEELISARNEAKVAIENAKFANDAAKLDKDDTELPKIAAEANLAEKYAVDNMKRVETAFYEKIKSSYGATQTATPELSLLKTSIGETMNVTTEPIFRYAMFGRSNGKMEYTIDRDNSEIIYNQNTIVPITCYSGKSEAELNAKLPKIQPMTSPGYGDKFLSCSMR